MTASPTFGELLRQHRLTAGLTQEALAERAGLSVHGIQKLERGVTRPYRDTVQRLLRALRLPPEDEAELLAAAEPAPRPMPLRRVPDGGVARHNLPVSVTSFVGREQDLAEVHRRLLEPGVRLLTLTGAPGVGKTRLALQVAAGVLEHLADGVFVVPLAALQDAAFVVPTIAHTLGVQEQSGTPLAVTLEQFLRDKSLLLVLDNFEQVLPAAVSVAQLIGACPLLRVLVTSRALLRVYGEQEVAVLPLRVPSVPWPPPEQLRQYDAVRLLVERARAVRPDFGVTDEMAPAIAAVCARLDGLPLAIELAAARLNLLTPDALLARLNQPLDLLVGGPRDRPLRQQSLSGTIQWSFDLLDARQQALFRRLAVFVGGWTLEAAELVCASEGDLPQEVLNGLGALVDQSLIHQDVHARGEPRFNMLESIREFALRQLGASGEADVIQRKHVDYFIKLGERAAPELNAGPEHVRWIDRLDRDKHNLRAALLWCAEHGEVERGLQLGGAIWRYWYFAGSLSEARDWGRHWLDEALPLAEHVAPGLRAKVLRSAAELSYAMGDYAVAKARFEQAAVEFRRIDDRPGLGATLAFLGRIVARTATTPHEHARGRAMLEEAIELNRQADSLWYCAFAMYFLGTLLWERSELDGAAALCGQSETLLRHIGEHHVLAHVRYVQGAVARDQGDFTRARRLIEQSVAELRAFNCFGGVAEALYFLAGLTRLQGEPAVALDEALECLLLQHRLNKTAELATCVELLAGLASDMDQPEYAAMLLGAAAAVRERIGVPMPPILQAAHQRDSTIARTQLGRRRFEEACARGTLMDLDQLVEYARQLGGPIADGTISVAEKQRAGSQ